MVRNRRSSPRNDSSRKLSFESLEGRQLMASHVCTLAPVDVFPAADEPPAAAATSNSAFSSAVAAATFPLTAIPVLNSLPGAAATLFLDFDGHFDAVWGSQRNISTPVFDTDGNPASFSDAELTAIRQIWQAVAEDYAPFNINVTTIQPPSFADRVAQRVAIGGDGAWLGDQAGGVSYVDSFTNRNLVNTSYVFPRNLANGHWKFVAEAASHEAGHAFGLDHSSGYNSSGRKTSEYYAGPGDGRAPIMGNSYNAARGVWWAGATTSASTFQDDLSTIARSANGFGYRPDDHGNSISAATPLVQSGNTVSASGVITIMSDVDYFRFTTGDGQVTFSAIVPAGFNNLDTRLELRDAAGTLIASAAPTTSFNSTITATLAAGTYYVAVASQGNYGDVGQYTLSGAVVATAAPTAQPPAAPSGLSGVAVSPWRVHLHWSDNSNSETASVIQRSRDGVNWSTLGKVPANITSVADISPSRRTTYFYRVLAVTDFGYSAPSNVIVVRTPSFSALA